MRYPVKDHIKRVHDEKVKIECSVEKCDETFSSKGQIISECHFDVFKFSKNANEKFDKFLSKNLRSGQIMR